MAARRISQTRPLPIETLYYSEDDFRNNLSCEPIYPISHRNERGNKIRMAIRKESRGFRISLLRGLIGGALGGFLWAALTILLSIRKFGSTWDQWFFVEFVLFGLPMGLFVGGVVGFVIWLIRIKREISLGLIGRFVVGSLIGLVPWLVDFWLTSNTGYLT